MTQLIILIALIVICILAGSRSKVLRGMGIGVLMAAHAVGAIVFLLLIIGIAGFIVWSIFN